MWIQDFLKNLFFESAGCPVCSREGAGLCPVCQKEVAWWGSFRHEGISGWAMVHYHGSARQLIYNFKQKGSWEARRALDEIMDRWLEQGQTEGEIDPQHWDCMVPVPSAPARRKKRGFDPAALLCRHFSERTGIPLLEALDNTGGKEHKTMDRRERRTAAKGSFRLRPSRGKLIQGQRVLIFDDIMTTGNTLAAAADLLRGAGARQIGFVVLQRATR